MAKKKEPARRPEAFHPPVAFEPATITTVLGAGVKVAPWMYTAVTNALKKEKPVLVRILASGKHKGSERSRKKSGHFIALLYENLTPHTLYLEEIEIAEPKNTSLEIVELPRNRMVDLDTYSTGAPQHQLPLPLFSGPHGRRLLLLWIPTPLVNGKDLELPAMITVRYRMSRLDTAPSGKDTDTIQVRTRNAGPDLLLTAEPTED